MNNKLTPAQTINNALTLRGKLIIAFVSLALLPVAAIGYYADVVARDLINKSTQQDLTKASNQTALQIDSYISGQMDSIRTEAQQPFFSDYLELSPGERAGSIQELNARQILVIFSRKDPTFIKSYALLERHGFNLLDTDERQTGEYEGDLDYFKESFTSGLPFASSIFFQEENVFYIGAPVRNENGDIIGVLRAKYDAVVVQSMLLSILPEKGTKDFLSVIDKNTYVRIADTGGSENLYRSLKKFSPGEVLDLQSRNLLPLGKPEDVILSSDEFVSGFERLLQEPFFTAYSDSINTDALITGTPLTTVPWVVIEGRSQEALSQPIDDQRRATILIAFLILTIAVFAALMVSQVIARPVVNLTSVAKKIAAGDLEATAPVLSNDEVGALAQTFNIMTEKLRQTLAGLEEELREREQAEEVLRQSEDKYRTLAEQIPAVVYTDLADGSGKTLYISPYVQNMLGYSAEDWIAQPDLCDHLIHPDDRERVFREGDNAKRTERFALDYRYIAKDGHVVWVRDEASLLKDQSGQPKFWQGVMLDITAQKHAEEGLLQFRKVMDESSDAIFMIDPETSHYIGFNKSAYVQLGYSSQELSRLGVINIAQHITSMEVWHERVEIVREKGGLIFESSYRRKDGTIFPVEVSARMLDYGERAIMVAVARDTTERKQAEDALRESEERFRKIFHSSPVAICITTLEEGRLLDANYAYWNLTGYVPEESIGRNAEELKMWDIPEERVEFVKKLKHKSSLFNPDDYFYHTDGSIKYVISFYELIQIGKEDCIMAMFYDMSAQKATMQALQKSEARVRALLEAMPDMIFELSREGVFLDFIPSPDVKTLLPPEEFLGRNIRDIMPSDVSSPTMFAVQRAIETGQLHAFEYQLPIGNEVRSYEARVMALSDKNAISIVRDITLQKQLERDQEGFINELEIKNAESETLRESLASIVGTFEFTEIIDRILRQIKRVVPYDTASVWRVEGRQQIIIAGIDLPPEIHVPGTVLIVNENNSAYPLIMGSLPYLLNNNVQEELTDFQDPPDNYVNSWLAVPLKTRGKIIGLIALDGRKKNQFNEHHAELAVTFANQVAIALENASLFYELHVELEARKDLIAELEAKNAEAETLRESAAIVAATLEKTEAIDRILEQLERVVPYNSASVQLLQGDFLEIVGGRGLPQEINQIGIKFKIDSNEPAYSVLQGDVPFTLYADVQPYITAFNEPPHDQIRAWLAVPLKVKGNVIGIIALDGNRVSQFSERHAQLAVTYASQVAIALENARLFSELQGELTERKQAEINLRQRESILEVVADAANQFLKTSDWKTEINTILERLGKIINASHAYLFENHQSEDGAMVTSMRFEWTAPGFPSDLKNPLYTNAILKEGDLETWYANMVNGFPYIGDGKHLDKSDMDYLLGRGMKALLDVPIYVDGKWWGTIGFDDMANAREWSSAEIDALLVAGNVLGAAIQRQQADARLQGELAYRKQLNAELESKNAELERFTYTVSHDLKSPLFTIRGFLGYLEQDALSGNQERLRTDIQRISDATDKMKRLLDELLELSRIGRLKNASQPVPFDELAREVVELVQGRIMERGIVVQIDENLPTVFGDRQRFFEVLQNLVDNAAKFMGSQKEPRIEIGQAGEDADLGMPVFYVRDNGMGIQPEHHERIFGLFNKLDPLADGTGIGLSMVKRIVEVHGGRIWVESEAGKGATFLFTLPAGPAN